ncbi:MAG: glycoside hydrolase family 5 protein, partial [Clostridiales bacterium]|nr:glycoside hydrolase family 5 protein [Clostridiales bacterium]
NTMFSIHMYGSAGGNSSSISSNLNNVTKQNLCVIVGEFGHNHSDGDVDEAYIMKYCTEKKIGYLGWSWKGNGGGVEYLDIAYYWDGSLLSSDWGHVLINGTNGIKKTSKTCSVFK